MTTLAEPLLETDLAQDVCCEFEDGDSPCGSPANFRMRMHLPNDIECTGCSTRTMHACTPHKDEMVELVSSGHIAWPIRCLCGRMLNHASDIIVWIHPLR